MRPWTGGCSCPLCAATYSAVPLNNLLCPLATLPLSPTPPFLPLPLPSLPLPAPHSCPSFTLLIAPLMFID